MILFIKSHVHGYTRRDGVSVAAHEDKRHSHATHPVAQAMSVAAKPANLVEGENRRNPGEPSQAQANAGEYDRPTVEWRGLTIRIDNPAGSVRRKTNRHGVSWEIRVTHDYGDIEGTMGVDGDPVDVYLGQHLDAPMVYVVHQHKVGRWDEFDEDKCMIGFDSQASAEAAFLANYNDPRFLGSVTAMPVDEFITKVRATRDKPAMIKAHVSGYTKHDGTFVPPHEDRRAQSLEDDIGRQEKWLQSQARDLGYRDIEDLLEKDYPAFERLATKWREDNPVEVALKSMVLFIKGYVGSYVRGGHTVQGYHGRTARAHATPGQLSLFDGPEKILPTKPSPSSNLSNNEPVANKQELKMSDLQKRAIDLSGEGFDDFSPEQLEQQLATAEKFAYGMPVSAESFRARLIKERERLARVAALPPKNENKPKFDERMYGSPRMTNTNDQPNGYMGD